MAQALKRIFNQGITDYPYTAYKSYEVTDTNYSSSFEISIFRGISPNGVHVEVSQSKHQGIEYDNTILTVQGATTKELNKIPQKLYGVQLTKVVLKVDMVGTYYIQLHQ